MAASATMDRKAARVSVGRNDVLIGEMTANAVTKE
jgi:hypothetical protein